MKRLKLAKPGRGTPVAHLAQAHRQFAPRYALKDNIGDGFLLEFNPVFRAVRREAVARGLRFSKGAHPDYFSFPLMSLDDAIDARRIPYRPNAAWLGRLAGFTLEDLKKGELQFNYLFHESAHYLAHREFFGARPVSREPKSARTLLAIMVGEAFANMVECLAGAFVEGEIYAFFLDANCHFRANEREVRELRRALRRHGGAKVARALLASFLYSNYLFEKLSAAQLGRVARFSGIPAGPGLRRLAAVGLQLNEKFRTVTTPLHLRKCGFKPAALEAFFRADPLLGDRRALAVAARLADIAAQEADPAIF